MITPDNDNADRSVRPTPRPRSLLRTIWEARGQAVMAPSRRSRMSPGELERSKKKSVFQRAKDTLRMALGQDDDTEDYECMRDE